MKNKTSVWFLLPLLLTNVLVFLIPGILTIFASFTKWAGINTPVFIGITNYIKLLGDPVFYIALVNNIKWLIVFLIVPVIMAVFGAFLLAPIKQYAMFFRVAYFLPYILMTVVNAQIWRGMMNPITGVGTWLANLTGWQWLGIYWLARPATTLYAVAFVDNWHFWGFLVVIYLTAMQSIDQEQYEAAQIEGANRFQELIHVTLPGIRPTMTTMWLLIAIWSFLVFDYIYVLTSPLGGQGHSAEVLATYAYSSGFKAFEFGYATAVGMAMTLITLVISGVYIYVRRKGWEI